MNFTMDVVENGRNGLSGAPTSMGVSYASHVSGAQVVHQQQAIITAQQVSNATHQQHSHQQQVQLQRIAVHQHQHPAQHVVTVQETPSILSVHQHHQNNHHQHHEQNSLDHSSELAVQDISKEEPQEYTPPRVDSVATIVSQSDGREKHSDESGLDVMIRVEVRGSIPGITPATLEKDKDMPFFYEFTSVQEMVQFFSRSPIAQPIDALNFISPELMRSINPELVRNHFLYVPTSADGGSKPSNNNSFTVMAGTQAMTVNNSTNNSATIQLPVSSSGGGGGGKHTIKQERKRGELPPGTIIHRPPPPDPNAANVFACWICGLDLQKSLSFEEHMAEVHNVEKPYRCDGCGVTFKRKAHLDRHRRIHLPTRPYQCGICGKGFTRNEHVRRHSYTHSGGIVPVLLQASDSGSRVVVPSGTTILNSPIVQQSTNSNGNSVETIFVNGSSHSPQSSNNHIESSQQTTVSLVSSSSSQMHHQQQVSVVPSSTSNHVISDGQSVGHPHKKSKNSEDPEKAARPYICEVCQKAFIRNEHLRRHVLTHSGEKPFSCNICNKAFSRREHLTKHARSHHKNSEMVNSVSNGEMSTIHQQVVGNQEASQQHIQHSSGQQTAPTTIHLVGTVTSEGTLVTGPNGPSTNGSGQHIQHHQTSAGNHNNAVLAATPGTILSVSSGNGLSHQATIVAQSGSLLNHGAVAQLSNGVPTVVYGMIAEVV